VVAAFEERQLDNCGEEMRELDIDGMQLFEQDADSLHALGLGAEDCRRFMNLVRLCLIKPQLDTAILDMRGANPATQLEGTAAAQQGSAVLVITPPHGHGLAAGDAIRIHHPAPADRPVSVEAGVLVRRQDARAHTLVYTVTAVGAAGGGLTLDRPYSGPSSAHAQMFRCVRTLDLSFKAVSDVDLRRIAPDIECDTTRTIRTVRLEFNQLTDDGLNRLHAALGPDKNRSVCKFDLRKNVSLDDVEPKAEAVGRLHTAAALNVIRCALVYPAVGLVGYPVGLAARFATLTPDTSARHARH
jgi:hypothetical protein